MTRDLQEIKAGLAQVRAALNLLERFIAEYEARSVNILPTEDVKFCSASDDELISSPGLGELTSLTESIHATAQSLHLVTESGPAGTP
jgi:hypothetical protein